MAAADKVDGGTERVPLESYVAMLDAVFDKALKRSNHE
jgi:hypothetical protein